MPTYPFRLKPDAVRARLSALRLSQAELAHRIGVPVRTVQYWMSKRRPMVSEEDVCAIAEALGVGTNEVAERHELVRTSEAERSTDLESLAKIVLEPSTLDVARRYLSYLRHVSFRFWPRWGYVQPFRHDGSHPHQYAELALTWPSDARVRRFVFAFQLGLLRVEYGEIVVREYDATLISYFVPRRVEDRSALPTPGKLAVRTWFGAEMCNFYVTSSETFELSGPTFPLVRDVEFPPEQPGLVYFRAAPHHLIQTK